MNDASKETLDRIKHHCLGLYAVAIRKPEACEAQLLGLYASLQHLAPTQITQADAKHIWHPIELLWKEYLPENCRLVIFDILAWLVQSQWYIRGGPMATQLVRLFGASLKSAQSEELQMAVYHTLQKFFLVAARDLLIEDCRMQLSGFIALALKEDSSPALQLEALRSLSCLYKQLDGDGCAATLPGTISTLSRTLVKHNQKSAYIVAGIEVLETLLLKTMDGIESTFRSTSWYSATEAQLALVLDPLLPKIAANDSQAVIEKLVSCSVKLLSTKVPAAPLIRLLLHIAPQAIPAGCEEDIGDELMSHVDTFQRILGGADDARKVHLMNTISAGLQLVTKLAKKLISERLLEQIHNFVQFTDGANGITMITMEDGLPAEPTIAYLSLQSHNALKGLLSCCTATHDLYDPLLLSSAEHFWIVSKVGIDTYDHALTVIQDQTNSAIRNGACSINIALQAILLRAKQMGRSFRSELSGVLYHILALPQPHFFVIQSIATSCDYNDTREMLIANSDYILNSLACAYHDLNMTPNTPKILSLLVQLAPETVELVDDVVDTIFKVLDDYHQHDSLIEGIFSALSSLVNAVLQQAPKSAFENMMNTIEPDDDKSLGERFEEVKDDASSSPVVGGAERKASKSYEIVLKIMRKAQIFLSHESRLIRLKILELIWSGALVIAQNEDMYLPLVHQYWPQLTRRLEDPDAFVVAAVLRVIERTVTLAGSFMRMRIVADVVPALQTILQPRRARGLLPDPRQTWQGTGRREVAGSVEKVLTAVVRYGGLDEQQRAPVLALARDISDRSEAMRLLLAEIESNSM